MRPYRGLTTAAALGWPLLVGVVAVSLYLSGGGSDASIPDASDATPRPSVEPGGPLPTVPPSAGGAATPEASGDSVFHPVEVLDGIPEAATRAPGYLREAFGPGWGDPDRNGCDARNDVLARDLESVVFRAGTHDCVVASGVLVDPYTGRRIDFVRGEHTSELVQIDHVVPLAWAWGYGAASWDPHTREAFANDASNLLAVDGEVNQQKSDGGPSEWVPPDGTFSCAYGTTWVRVLAEYGLTLPSADRRALVGLLASCPG